MSLRKIETRQSENGHYTARIYRDAEAEEYVVKFALGTKALVDADYFTDDLADARGTADFEIERYHDRTLGERRAFEGRYPAYSVEAGRPDDVTGVSWIFHVVERQGPRFHDFHGVATFNGNLYQHASRIRAKADAEAEALARNKAAEAADRAAAGRLL